MRHINPIFRTPRILRHIADLIIDYNYHHYSDLSEADKGELTALLIEASGRDGEHECIVESAHFDQTINLFKNALKLGTQEANENFLEAIKAHAVGYYDYTMQELFEDVYENYQQERREWANNLSRHGDPDEQYDRYREQVA